MANCHPSYNVVLGFSNEKCGGDVAGRKTSALASGFYELEKILPLGPGIVARKEVEFLCCEFLMGEERLGHIPFGKAP